MRTRRQLFAARAAALGLLLSSPTAAASEVVVELSGAQLEAACAAAGSEVTPPAARFEGAFPTFQTGAAAILTEGEAPDRGALLAWLEATGIAQPRLAECEGPRVVLWLGGIDRDPTSYLAALPGYAVEQVHLVAPDAAIAQLDSLTQRGAMLAALQTQTAVEICDAYADSAPTAASTMTADAPSTGRSAEALAAWAETNRRSGALLCLPTTWHGETVLRICVVNPSTDPDEVLTVLRTLQ